MQEGLFLYISEIAVQATHGIFKTCPISYIVPFLLKVKKYGTAFFLKIYLWNEDELC